MIRPVQPVLLILGVFFWLGHIPVRGQIMTAEIMAGHRNIWYQQNISKTIDSSRFGFSHVSTLHAFYDPQNPTELMSQSYLSFSIINGIKVSAGFFYASAPGFRPSVNMEFSKKYRSFLVVFVPRVDMWENPAFDGMLLMEYTPAVSPSLQLFFRFQTMLNFSATQHNRSYQNLRIGFVYRKIQFGFALNLDAYGKGFRYYPNAGVFLRRNLF